MSVLDELGAAARARVEAAEKLRPLAGVRAEALSRERGDFPFGKALAKPGLSFICECKKASPSKGVISPDYPYLDIAGQYEAAGADAVSVLTEPTRFSGDMEHLRAVAGRVKIPVLRKDFTVDPYMIYEAKNAGAAAVLLICALLDEPALREYLSVCEALGLDALVETRDEREIEAALRCGAKIVGVNNRDLRDFSVDVSHAGKLRRLVPPGVLFVAESGINSPADTAVLREIGADAALVGEAMMRASDKTAKLRELRDEPDD